ncbi:MAG: 6-bladed beta-propeller [Bacteroidota bacterium]|nr:6-bladed beta-propeller [Bacteroidota bacterium]
MMSHKIKYYLILLLFALHCLGLVVAQDKGIKLVYPPSPQKARIQHLLTINSMKDIEKEPSFFSKIVKWVFGGTTTSRWLVQPVGITVSDKEKIFVADPAAKTVHIIDLGANKYENLLEFENEKFISPVGLTISDDGDLYVSDSEKGEVIVVDENLKLKFRLKEKLIRPTGIVIVRDKLYVVDTGLHKVWVFDLYGKYLNEFGSRGAGEGEFNYPVSITAKNNFLYVVDALNYRIQIFDLDGKYISSFGKLGNAAGYFSSPKSVSTDSDSNIYVTDALFDNFQIFNQKGELLLLIGKYGSDVGMFISPNGIFIDKSDKVYVVDTFNKRIQIFKYLK